MIKENTTICKGCSLKLTKENKDKFVKKSGNRGISNQCKTCRNTENKLRYQSKKKQNKGIKGCVYEKGTNLITKIYSY